MTTSILLHAGCALLYGLLAVTILLGRRRDRTAWLLSVTCLVTGLWAAGIAIDAALFAGGQADELGSRLLELAQQAAWYGFVLHLYGRAVPNGSRLVRLLTRLGLVAIFSVGASIAITTKLAARLGLGVDPLAAFGIDARLGLAICALLVIENLYRNTSEDLRWHISLSCVALGALFVYDIVLYSDAALFRRTSAALFDGRAVLTALLTPLLSVAARRNRRRWGLIASQPNAAAAMAASPARLGLTTPSIKVSHRAVFYSATLVVTGIFLLSLALTGELLRALAPERAAGWGALIEVALICGGVLAVAVLLTSGSARSSLRNVLVNNFLTHRYDYRLEWLRCIETLSQTNSHVALHTRVIKAVAQTVDSPAGMAFLRDAPGSHEAAQHAAFRWAGSWNLPSSCRTIAADHPSVSLFGDGAQVVEAPSVGAFVAGLGPEGLWVDGFAADDLWLAVPLSHAGFLLGFILLSRPRAAFALNQEVFALLRIVGQEVASYIAEQRAAEVVLQTRQLREYGQRFAFVAHDIKNVASQLSLLLANAEHHIANPAFQRDMLATIGGSVQKITTLLARLKAPVEEGPQSVVSVPRRLNALIAGLAPGRQRRTAFVNRLPASPTGAGTLRDAPVKIAIEAFDSVMTHLLDNAFEASAAADEVQVVCQLSSGSQADMRVLIDIIDHGVGMTADFIHNGLFQPFRSSKSQGFGIGVYQARELLREAGGDLIVTSAPGRGTTMRLSLPLFREASVAIIETAA